MKGIVSVTCGVLVLGLLVGCTTTQQGAASGATIGGLAGGIIGHNQNGRTAEGVGIGAAAGAVLGGLAGNQLDKQKEQARREGYEAGRRDAQQGTTGTGYQSDNR